MQRDNTIKKTWYILTNGHVFNDQPKDVYEKRFFDETIKEAKRCGLNVKEVWSNKTEKEFYERKI